MTVIKEEGRGFLRIVLFIWIILLKCCRGLQLQCSIGQFFDLESFSCRNCSSCINNEIISQTCTDYSDTVCGPFYEFSGFLNHIRTDSSPRVATELVTSNLSADLREDTWDDLALVLIGCLTVSVIVLVALTVTAVVIYLKKKREKQLWKSDEDSGLYENNSPDLMKDTDKMLTSVLVSQT